jgi:hypothetical protein
MRGPPSYEDANSSPSKLDVTRGIYEDAANSSAEKMYQQTMQNTESAKGLLKGGETFESGLGNPEQAAQLDAVRSKVVMPQVDRAFEDLRHRKTRESDTAHFSKLATASEMVGQEQAMNYQKALEKYKRKQARKKARAQMLGTVLGVVGGVVGGVYGGPAGAAAGYAGGNAIGNAVGGA